MTNPNGTAQPASETTVVEQSPEGGEVETKPTGEVITKDPETQDTHEKGYEWQFGIVSYRPDGNQGAKVQLGKTPYLRVTDTVKFEKFLPGVIAASLDGTSIKVRCQGITRPMLQKNRKVSTEDMQRAILNSLRGVRAPRSATIIERVVEKTKFVAIDGKEFDTQLEARQWSMAVMAEQREESAPQA